jgi:tetratricopeptide (TPR) repeat protein
MEGFMKLIRIIMGVVVICVFTVSCSDSAVTDETVSYFIGSYNILIDDVPDLLERFFDKIPEDGGIEFNRRLTLFSPTIAARNIEEAKNSFSAGFGKAGAGLQELKQESKNLMDAAVDILDIYTKAYNYLNREDYKDDDGSALYDLLENMKSAREKYYTAVDTVSQLIDEYQNKRIEEELAQYASAKDYSYWIRKYPHEALKIITQLEQDNDAFINSLPEFKKTFEGLSAFCEKKGDTLHKAFASFHDLGQKFYNTVIKIERAINENIMRDSRDFGNLYDNSITFYNGLIDITNSLYELEANDLLK